MARQKPEGLLFTGKQVLFIVLPLVAEQFLAFFVGMADSVMISSVGEAAVSAVSLVDSISILIIMLFTALATGGSVVAGQLLGAKENERARQVTDQLVLLVTLIGAAVTAVLFFTRTAVLSALYGSVEPQVMDFSQRYFVITLFSFPFIALYNAGAAIFRAMADSRTPMLISFLMNFINIAGNAALIFGFHFEVEGVAIPTLVSRMVGALVIFLLLFREKYPLHFSRPFRLRLQWSMVKRILGIGIPNSVENGMFQVGKLLVIRLIASFGTVAITANAVGNAIGVFQILPGSAIGVASVTIISRCYGAGLADQVRYYAKRLLGMSFLFNILINILLGLAIPVILQMYNLSEETGALTTWVLLFSGVVSAVIWPAAFSFPNVFRATGDVKYTMVISVVSMWLFRVALSYILGGGLGLGLQGVWYGMAVDWTFRSVMFLARFKSRKWNDRLEHRFEPQAEDA